MRGVAAERHQCRACQGVLADHTLLALQRCALPTWPAWDSPEHAAYEQATSSEQRRAYLVRHLGQNDQAQRTSV